MCGIFGVSHNTDVTRRMLPLLALEMEFRGRDSWGATDGTSTYHSLGYITDGWYDAHLAPDGPSGWDRVIYHTRGASTGAVTLQNAHPYTFTHTTPDGVERRVVGIHNGIISNHEALLKKYSRTSEVDSMHIYQHISEGLPTEELCGWGNLAWYTTDSDYPTGTLRLLRFNNDALHVAKLTTGEIVFCSLKDSIIRASAMAGSSIHKFFTIEPETVYRVGTAPDGDWVLFQRTERMRFGGRVAPWVGSFTQFPHHPTGGDLDRPLRMHNPPSPLTLATLHQRDRANHICIIPACDHLVTPSRRDGLLCKKHLAEVVDDFKPVAAGVGV